MTMTDSTAIRTLLQHPTLHTLQEEQGRSSAHHNIFELLGLGQKETAHSAFLAYLLHPMGRHGQGATFLNAWLHWLHQQHGHPLLCGQGGHAMTERFAGHWGRIDIVVELRDGSVLAIENKVGAGEQDAQLARYGDWLQAQPGAGQRWLVFLTPDGRPGATARSGQPVIAMSYAQLADVLEGALHTVPQTAHALRADVTQYIRLCRHLHTSVSELPMHTIHTEILNLLDDPRHLQSALTLAQHVETKAQEIRATFQQHVLQALTEHLEQLSCPQPFWSAMVDPRYTGVFGIGHAQHFTQHYCCVVEWLSNNVSIGWRKSEGSSHCAHPELSQQMCAQLQGKSEYWWLCRRTLPNAPWRILWTGSSAPEQLLQLQADNLGTHALAKELAQEIWACFALFEAQVRLLPSVESPCPL